MSDTSGTHRPGVSIHEAAVMLGVSPTTVRRWVANGKLRSQRFDRPQGEVVRVFVGPEKIETAPVAREQIPELQVPTDVPPRADEQAPASSAMAVWSEAFLVPLVNHMAEQEATIRAQAEKLGRLGAELEATAAESIALKVRESRHLTELETLRAELERAASALVAMDDERAPARAPGVPTAAPGEPAATIPPNGAPKSRWHALWPLLTFWTLAAVVLAVVLAGALLAWLR